MLIVIAEESELKLVEKLGYKGENYIVSGVGGINIINALKDIDKNEEILNIGYAGSNTLEVGLVVDVSESTLYHEKVSYLEPIYSLHSKNDNNIRCYTSTDFVTKTNIETPCVFDMELAFICALGFKNVRALKYVSDNLNYNQYKSTESK